MDPVSDAKRLVELALEDNGFLGYRVKAFMPGTQVFVSVAKGQCRAAEGTPEVFLKVIVEARRHGVPLDVEFANWNLFN